MPTNRQNLASRWFRVSSSNGPQEASSGGAPQPSQATRGGWIQGVQILAVLELLLGLIALAVAWMASLPVTLVMVAWLVCAVSTLVAHVAAEFPRGVEYALARMLVGMAARTVLPLLFAVWGLYLSEPPMEREIVFVLVLLYLVGLVADSVLSIKRVQAEIPQRP